MEHSTYKEMLSALFDGELDGAEREAALAHMDGCADCRAYFAELTVLRAALGGLEEFDAPEDFAAGVMTRLHAGDTTAPPCEEGAAKAVKKRASWRRYAALAACAAVILLAVHTLPDALRMGGGNALDQAVPETLSGTAATTRSDSPSAAAPAPSSVYDNYAYKADSGGGDAPESAAEEDGASYEKTPTATNRHQDNAEAPAENSGAADKESTATASGASNSETYAAEGADEPLSITNNGEFSVQPLSKPEVFGGEYPVLTLFGEGAESWLAEYGWQGESGAWYAEAAALRALPDGLTLSDGGVPDDYDGAVQLELGEAEP